jgi:hypothetical protein
VGGQTEDGQTDGWTDTTDEEFEMREVGSVTTDEIGFVNKGFSHYPHTAKGCTAEHAAQDSCPAWIRSHDQKLSFYL